MIAAFIVSLITVGVSTFAATYLQSLINNAVESESFNFLLYIPIAVLLLGLWCVLAYAIDQMLSVIINKSRQAGREYFYGKIMNTDAASKYPTGDLLSRAFEEAPDVVDFLAIWKIKIFTGIIQAVIYFIVLAYFSWIIALIVFAVYPFYFIVCYKVNKRIAVNEKSVRDGYGAANQIFLQGVGGIRTLKSFGKEKKYHSVYSDSLTVFLRILIKNNRNYAFLKALSVFAQNALPMLMAVVSIFLVSVDRMQIGTVLLVFILTAGLLHPLMEFTETIQWAQITGRLYERIKPIMREENPDCGTIDIDGFDNLDIDIKEFVYGGGDNKILLKDFKLKLNKRDKVMIVGESGSGKSTLLKLIIKQIGINGKQGTVKINGIDVSRITTASLYKNLIYQSQDPFVFEGTLKDNIFLYDAFSDEEFDEIKKVCALDDFISEYGENHVIAENGENISGGQLQRICLARALIRKPELLLLDEPTSALDSGTTEIFVKNLAEYLDKYGTAMICVTHNSGILGIGDVLEVRG